MACGLHGPRSVRLVHDEELVVGRHASCRLSLPNPTLSRFHARFVRQASKVVVEDLGSRHGTWFSGQRIARAELDLGASVRLADVVVSVAWSSALELPVLKGGADALLPGAIYLNERMRELLALLHRAAQVTAPVLLLGETGTGKELAAREIHLAGRRTGPLRTLNCAAIPPQLVESTLFGHERGAFTGADRTRPGIFEDANGGTLFLDEVGELPLTAQAALLRVLETKSLTRVGASREIEVDVRIVSATNRDVHAMAARGEFRTDLLHRLCVIPIELPPLRERRDEIATLTRHFLAEAEGAEAIDATALARLEAYHWPGNVRELRNVLARAAALAPGPCITERDLPSLGPPSPIARSIDLGQPSDRRSRDDAPARTLRGHLRSVERAEVLRALASTGGNQRKAAALLGVPLRTFERRLRALRESC